MLHWIFSPDSRFGRWTPSQLLTETPSTEETEDSPLKDVGESISETSQQLWTSVQGGWETTTNTVSSWGSRLAETPQTVVDGLNETSETVQTKVQLRWEEVVNLKQILSEQITQSLLENYQGAIASSPLLNGLVHHPLILFVFLLVVLALTLSLLLLLTQAFKRLILAIFVVVFKVVTFPFSRQDKSSEKQPTTQGEKQKKLLETVSRLEEIRLEENKLLREIAKIIRK
ncbi:hypothetical protein [Spirulina sp. CS-785/01]|uniref:hypothetical protein n=1 Tax=Spirulina sp. CS-785/01 TaxID=3021716 RepID=UPI00232CED05|nr:hypothetical protein [Spirulina sp. CS-785/01]